MARSFHLRRLKNFNESYFEGKKPDFRSVPEYAYDFSIGTPGSPLQSPRIQLSEGEVAIVFDLRAPLLDQIEIATGKLRSVAEKWRKSNSIVSPKRTRRLSPLDSEGRIELTTYLQAWDEKKFEKKSAKEIGEALRFVVRGTDKSVGERLLDSARYYIEHGYRELMMNK